MPEAAVDENHLAAASKDHIGTTRQILGMNTVSITDTEGEFAHDKFRFGVLRPDAGHDFGSELRRDRIQGALDITP